jgi:hypothetical protein
VRSTPDSYKGHPLHFKIANSEPNDAFPPTTNRLPDREIKLTARNAGKTVSCAFSSLYLVHRPYCPAAFFSKHSTNSRRGSGGPRSEAKVHA